MGKGDPVRGHQAGVIRGTFRRSITSPFREPPYRAALSQLHREDCTFVAWYRSLYAPRTGGAYDSHHRTAGIAGCTRRRGGGVAARGASAAGGQAADRMSDSLIAANLTRITGPALSVQPTIVNHSRFHQSRRSHILWKSDIHNRRV